MTALAQARIRAGATAHVVIEDVEFLAATGCQWAEIEARTGFCQSTIEVHLARHGRQDVTAKVARNSVRGLW